MKLSYLMCVSMVLVSCGFPQKQTEHLQHVETSQEELVQQHEAFRSNVQDQSRRRAMQQVNRPWVVGKAVALARDVNLPQALRSMVPYTLVLQSEQINLAELAQRIAQLSGLAVWVKPEALLPLTDFLPRYARPGAAPALPVQPIQTLALRELPLSRLLDHVAAYYGVYWRYKDQRIEFYRTEARSFTVRTLSQEAQAQASLGLNQTQTDGFSSQSSTQLHSASLPTLEIIKKRIEAFLTVSGTVIAEAGAGNLVIVNDTPEVLDQVADYLKRENRMATRRVRILFEELTLLVDDTTELAVDWDVLLKRAATSWQASHVTDPLGAGGSIAGRQMQGSTAGSMAALRALSAVGTVVRKQSTPVYTLNRRPVTHALRTTFSYVDKVEAMATQSGNPWAQPSLSISQKEQTVGSVLTLLPDVQDDGLVLLSVAYDSTVAQPLKSLSFGDRSAPLQVQQIAIDGSGTVQQIALRVGQVWLISGFDRHVDEGKSQRLGPQAPLLAGGQQARTEQRWRTVLLVSVQLEEED